MKRPAKRSLANRRCGCDRAGPWMAANRRWRGARAILEHSRNSGIGVLPLYLVRIEDLGRGDLVKVDCAACHHVALLTPEFLLRLGFRPHVKVLDLKWRQVPRMRGEGTGDRVDQVGAPDRVSCACPWHQRAPPPVRASPSALLPAGSQHRSSLDWE
jgi:hypothetical protein